MPEPQPISWRSIVYGTPVTAADGARIGAVAEVLGSDADDIASMSLSDVATVLTRSEIDRLPAYDETATYHLASVGWLRKHLGWRKDAKSDDEPG